MAPAESLPISLCTLWDILRNSHIGTHWVCLWGEDRPCRHSPEADTHSGLLWVVPLEVPAHSPFTLPVDWATYQSHWWMLGWWMAVSRKDRLLDLLQACLSMGRGQGGAYTKYEISQCTQILLSATLRCAEGK